MQWRLEPKGAGSRVVRLRIDHSWRLVMMVPVMLRANPSPKTLASVYEREIIFRVLQGPHGWMLRDIAAPIGVERLAQRASMSVSGFHRHFKAVTNLSPLCSARSGFVCFRPEP